MDASRWQRIDEIFAAALERPAAERVAFLDQACGDDPDLRREVESLLAHDDDETFLDTTAAAEATQLLGDAEGEGLIGSRLDRFEVLGRLGAGGMGEVYLAQDPKLERRVALKLLPPHLAADAETMRRFRREALAVSALNHPNILTVHEVLEVGGREVLVSELIEGVTLRERLRKGPLPMAAALEVTAQIARGLEAAHRVGIVHRDIKPENVMVREDGLVKILDFGIAKSPTPRSDERDLSESPTHVQTAIGVILGTASYMSPEQARGEPATQQTDIWALGCVLFEALTGRQTFPGRTVTEVLAAILTQEPEFARLPVETPPLVRSLLRRCLDKKLAQRLHDVADARLELEEAMREPMVAATVAPPRRRLPLGVAAVLAAAIVAGVGLGAWLLGHAAGREPALPARFHLQPPPGLELVRATEATIAVSRDGRAVAFVARPAAGGATRLYLRRVDDDVARPLGGAAGATNPFFSPDGEWVGFHSRGAIRKVSINRGEPLMICAATRVRGASWGDDGTIVFSHGLSLMRVPAAGGEPTPLTTPGDLSQHRWPHHLPGGRALLFQRRRGVGEARHEIAVLSLASGEQRTLLRGGSYPRYAKGQLVFGRLGTLYAVSFDPAGLALGGEPRAVLEDLWFFPGSSVRAYDLAATGVLVYSSGSPRLRDAELVEIDRQGRVARVAPRRGPFFGTVSVAPDGRRVAVALRSSLEEADLWTWEPALDRWTRLTTQGWTQGAAGWSGDGRWIYASTVVEGAWKVFRVAADGSGAAQQLTSGRSWDYPSSLSPDGRVLLIQRSARAGEMDLLTLDLAAAGPPRPLVATPRVEMDGDFSPQGRHVAFAADYEGAFEVYVRPYPGPGDQVKVSNGGGRSPRWSPRGDELFYVCPHRESGAPGICAVGVESSDGLTFGTPRRLAELERAEEQIFAVTPEVRSFYFVRRVPEAPEEARLVYAPGWTDELLAPK